MVFGGTAGVYGRFQMNKKEREIIFAIFSCLIYRAYSVYHKPGAIVVLIQNCYINSCDI